MAKPKSSFVCESCGSHFGSWAGKCPVCGEWNTIIEEAVEIGATKTSQAAPPAELLDITTVESKRANRLRSGLAEFDRVLGEEDPGIVGGSVVLLAGSPGVGKSTLLMQVASGIKGTLYFSAEESLPQIKLRADRLGIKRDQVLASSERDIDKIISAIRSHNPPLVIIDSIQTVFDETASGTPGSVVQVREIAWRLQQLAKMTGVAFVIIGHITKEGTIAGPKTLEHLVDVVLYLEGEKRTGLRLLHAEKNRYGSLDEVGIWQLTKTGFEAVDDPGKLFASLVTEKLPGRALSVTVEGSRAFLVEIQALVTKTAFGYPKRTSQGIDPNRLNVILAVLENRLGLPVGSHDIYINVVGGFSIKDPGIDLAIAAAILSGLSKKILPDNVVLAGELGLLGEVRPAIDRSRRDKEARRLGYLINTKITSLSQLQTLFR